ncbi:pimeloyl-ACP methyl ester carboxylesterase [Rhizobium sp. PP-F2F-G20b]|nr:pimeloyl-ACP methyl ester carboxylesterase [Rhizobium sp. PP-F2F-G20b]
MSGLKGLVLAFIVFALGYLGVAGDERWYRFNPPPPLPRADESGFASVNGIRMYYAVYGKGKGSPILLIHGGMGSADVWGFQVPILAKTHEVIVADSRGHGHSTRTDASFTYHLMAEDYIALLDTLKIERTALVGWSDGGIIGLDIALHHPERLTKLFAQAANVSPDGLLPQPRFSLHQSDGNRDETDYRRLSSTPDDYPAFREAVAKLWETEPHYTEADLQSIRVPTLIALGDHDEAVSRAHSEYIARTIPGARFLLLKDVGHKAIYQDPTGYAAAVLAFIDGPGPKS